MIMKTKQKKEGAVASLNQTVAFVNRHAKDYNGHPFQDITSKNFMTILSGEHTWNYLSADKKTIANGILLAAQSKSYDQMLAEAKRLKSKTNDFMCTYLMDDEGAIYQGVYAEQYEKIIQGKDAFEDMEEELKAVVNAILQTNGGSSYEQMLSEAISLSKTVETFLSTHMCEEENVYFTNVDASNYQKILSGEIDWNLLSPRSQKAINIKLDTPYEQLLNIAQMLDSSTKSFVKVYISSPSGELYSDIDIHNYEQVMLGKSFWKRISKMEKTIINQILLDHDRKIYEDLMLDAKEVEYMLQEFINLYMSNQDGIFQEVSAENYSIILSGEEDWNAMSVDEKNAINQQLRKQETLTYEEMLSQAKLFYKNIISFIKTYAKKKPNPEDLTKQQKDAVQAIMEENNCTSYDDLRAMASCMVESYRTPVRVIHKPNEIRNKETREKIMKLEEKAYKSTLAVAGVVSIAAAALLGKKKKK